MGNIDTQIDTQKDLTIQIVTGEITAQEIIAAIESYYQGVATRLILWDISQASLKKIRSEEVAQVAKLTQKYSRLRERGKTALLFSSELGFGLGRMYDINQDVERSELTHMSFRNRDEALAWLGVAL